MNSNLIEILEVLIPLAQELDKIDQIRTRPR